MPRDGRCASWSAWLAFLALGLSPAVARATTVLNVDSSTTVRPVTHAASGSLYGALETQPADVNGLIAPLHPYMFNNPAADIQQPIGDAIVVAGRVAPIGGKVTVRLADWFPGWPYKFTSITDWFDKLWWTIVSRRKSANLTNIYAYEILERAQRHLDEHVDRLQRFLAADLCPAPPGRPDHQDDRVRLILVLQPVLPAEPSSRTARPTAVCPTSSGGMS